MGHIRIAHFHCVTKANNRGDLAIVERIQSDLTRVLGDVEITSHNLLVLSKRPAVTNLLAIGLPDLVLIGGGGIYSDYFFPLRRQNIFLLRMLRKLGTSTVIIAPGIASGWNSTLRSEVAESIGVLNHIAALSSGRDDATVDFVTARGVACSLIADPCLLFDSPRPSRNASPIIGFNIASHGWRGQEKYLASILSEVMAGAKILQARGWLIRYMMHSDFEEHTALRFAAELGAQIVRARGQELIEHYAQLDCLVGMMMHSTVFACAAGTPIVALAYDEKNRSLARTMGYEWAVVDATEIRAADLVNRVDRTISEWCAETIEQKRLSLRRRYERFLKDIQSLVEKRSRG